MRVWMVVLALVLVAGCSKKKAASEATTGSGSAAGAAAEAGSAEAGSGSAAAVCSLDGSYRLRFHSNNTEGWWLLLKVSGKDVELGGAVSMLGLQEDGPLTVTTDTDACKLTLAKTTKQAGDVQIELQVRDTKVAGNVTRTISVGSAGPTTPITGRRDTSPETYPACIKPGVYRLGVTNVKKWALEGEPGDGNCEENADLILAPHVRVELLDGELLVDEVDGDKPYDQSFGRAKVKRTGECEATIALRTQDFDLRDATITFKGDSFAGKTTDFTYEVFEDGDAGENQWSCTTKDGDVSGTRVAD